MATKKAAKKAPQKQTKSRSKAKPNAKAKKDKPEEKMSTIFIMGKAHKVPADATIMGAIE